MDGGPVLCGASLELHSETECPLQVSSASLDLVRTHGTVPKVPKDKVR